MSKNISYDYLYGKRDIFPFTYKQTFLKLIDDAPDSGDKYDAGFQDGYDAGKAEEIGRCRV